MQSGNFALSQSQSATIAKRENWFTRKFSMKNYSLIEKSYLCIGLLNNLIMAIPVRSAPVLTGKMTEDFYDAWEKQLQTPPKNKFSKERFQKVRQFLAKQKFL
jgi:hypothetical protein